MSFVKKPCKTCPFRTDVTPFLHPDAAREYADSASNPYNSFLCHNTFEYDGNEDHQGRPTGDFSQAKSCAGFLTLQHNETGRKPEGFEPSDDLVYDSAADMEQACRKQYLINRKINKQQQQNKEDHGI